MTYKEAITIQNRLRDKVILIPPSHFSPQLVTGTDISYSRKDNIFYAVVVVLRLSNLELIEKQVIIGQTDFPYIPGLLSFREAPFLIKAVKQLKHMPDVILVDGQGIAHPRRIGLASHLGICLDIPTIGCAKSRLTGTYKPVPEEVGSYSLLQEKDETLGLVLRTKKGVKPIFVSPGHLMDAKTAYKIVMRCLKGYRLPEPTRLAHIEANRARSLGMA
ncbi:MAG: deoxyribonuclease V [Candidatus Desulfofervidaceae bacterium]|nr:deoxyribonuclease V [Candidatus Desulfofervidaceae bacterium]